MRDKEVIKQFCFSFGLFFLRKKGGSEHRPDVREGNDAATLSSFFHLQSLVQKKIFH